MVQKKVIVDADACPRNCMDILRREKSNFGYELVTVASFNHQIDNAKHIVVGNEPDAADIAVINQVKSGDIVVTQDWGLAALVLGKGGLALGPNGRIYDNQLIDFMLEERSVKAKVRRSGGRTKGPTARKGLDDRRFRESLIKLLQE